MRGRVRTRLAQWVRGVTGVGLLLGSWACESPLHPAEAATEWAQLTLGDGHGCVADREGRAACWGANGRGQLGLGREGQPSEPTWVRTPVRFASIDAGAFHTCGTAVDGTVWCWGANESGQLGTGDRNDRDVPTQVDLPGADWIGATAGLGHSCAVRSDGTGACWGRNVSGELGIGAPSAAPVPPTALEGRWQRIDAGWGHSCGVGASGRASCWGENAVGQLGTGVRTDAGSPSRVAGSRTWTSIAAGDGFTCGRTDDASVWCWGGDVAGFPVSGTGPGVGTPSLVASLSGIPPAAGPASWCLTDAPETATCRTRSGTSGTFTTSGTVLRIAVSRVDICFLVGSGSLECRGLAALRDS